MNDDKKKPEEQDPTPETTSDQLDEKKPEGSGIFTTDGKELPKIDGGYDIVGADSGLGDNDFDG